mgnify:CR=1 FL=1
MNRKKVLIFGITDLAQILFHFLQHDKTYNVCAFIANEKYIPKNYIISLYMNLKL